MSTTRWIAVKFGTKNHGPQMLTLTKFADPLTVPLAQPSAGWRYFMTKYLQTNAVPNNLSCSLYLLLIGNVSI